MGVGDQQASLLGVGISESNVVLNIGTGGQVATIGEFETEFPVKIRPFFGQSTVLTYTHLLSGRFLNLVLDTASYVYKRPFTHDDFNKELDYLSKSTFEYELEECLNKDYLLTMAKELGSTDFLNSAIETMSNQYAKAVNAIGGSDNKQIIFAGGVGQKNSLLASRIASKLSKSNFLISEAEETTLAGLTKLNDSIVNSNH